MNPPPGALARLVDFLVSNPIRGAAVVAALIALATTPLAMVILSRTEYLNTRRGRTYRRPEWWSVVCSMALVMAIPAIFLALVIKSQYFDADRYAFDPNKTWTVIDQGRGYGSVSEMNEAIRQEMERLAAERKGLVDGVKKLDQAMLAVRGSNDPAAAKSAVEALAMLRKAVGQDAPQQLLVDESVPVDLARLMAKAGPAPAVVYAAAPAGAAPAAPQGPGLSPAVREAELAKVPDPQRPLAAALPLTDLPAGWELGQSGDRYVESFNAENLYEKINGRAESFIQYGVKGMAYSYYRPTADQANEVQVYIFEMADALNALGKYSSEKPDEATAVALGAEGYRSGASVFFYVDKYYTQIVSTSDEPLFQDFALAMAERIAAAQQGKPIPTSAPAASVAAAPAAAASPAAPAAAPASTEPGKASPQELFGLLPAGPNKAGAKYVAQDVFGYSFLSNVFLADYKDGDAAWQGFVRTYPTADEAKAVFEKYREEAQSFDAKVKTVETSDADAMFVAENFGLADVVFLKGNAVGGVNGATVPDRASAFAGEFAKGMPASSPFVDSAPAAAAGEESH